MELSAFLVAMFAPLLLGMTPVATVKGMLARDCVDRHVIARPATRMKAGRTRSRERRYILM